MKVLIGLFFVSVLSIDGDAKEYYIQTRNVNWYAAMEDCALHDLQLATVETENERKALEKTMEKAGLGTKKLWLGGSDLAEKNEFEWTFTGETIAGQFEKNTSRHCVSILPLNKDTINNSDCSELNYFVCEDKPNNCYNDEKLIFTCQEMLSKKR